MIEKILEKVWKARTFMYVATALFMIGGVVYSSCKEKEDEIYSLGLAFGWPADLSPELHRPDYDPDWDWSDPNNEEDRKWKNEEGVWVHEC